MVTIANPIYDVVFKYLMEDRRVAMIILSSLLKKKVVELEFRKNEYPNIGRDDMSIFRIDFGATVEEEDGSRKMVLIELQKTWVPTETLRFRQYLGAQYASRDNMLRDEGGYALPMITIYILGHRVGDLEEPVLYVKRQVYDYQDRIVTKGIPDKFINSLTHDSIIVQIPLLKGKVSNRLEKILSVFDQSQITETNSQFLRFDESGCEEDSEMRQILFRLTAAAADADVRHSMNVEDEYFGLIEEMDTDILQKKQELAEQKAQLKEQKTLLKEQKAQLKERDARLKESDARLKERDARLKESDARLKERDARLKEKNSQLEEQHKLLDSMVKTMLTSGMTIEDIACAIGKDADYIKKITSTE